MMGNENRSIVLSSTIDGNTIKKIKKKWLSIWKKNIKQEKTKDSTKKKWKKRVNMKLVCYPSENRYKWN